MTNHRTQKRRQRAEQKRRRRQQWHTDRINASATPNERMARARDYAVAVAADYLTEQQREEAYRRWANYFIREARTIRRRDGT